jgi:hypothetical protein
VGVVAERVRWGPSSPTSPRPALPSRAERRPMWRRRCSASRKISRDQDPSPRRWPSPDGSAAWRSRRPCALCRAASRAFLRVPRGRLAADLGQHLARGPHHLVDRLNDVRGADRFGLGHFRVFQIRRHGENRTFSKMIRRGGRSTRVGQCSRRSRQSGGATLTSAANPGWRRRRSRAGAKREPATAPARRKPESAACFPAGPAGPRPVAATHRRAGGIPHGRGRAR